MNLITYSCSTPLTATSRGLTADVLIGGISAVGLSVTEQVLGDAGAVTAGQLIGGGAEGLVGVEARQHQLGPLRLVTVGHSVLPVAGLLLEVERQPGRAPDLLETLGS